MSTASLLVTAEWLKNALDSGEENLVLLDCSWFPQVKIDGVPELKGIGLFESKHIPGALHFDIDACITKTQYIPRNLPEQAAIEQYIRSFGIGPQTHVICYDRDDGQLMSSAAGPRICFTLKLFGHDNVSILDGGLLLWEKLGFPTEQGPAKMSSEVGDFVVNFQKDMVVDFDTMRGIVESGGRQIVDTRLPVNFKGEEPEPCLFTQLALMDAKKEIPTQMEKGHMKNAINIDFLVPYDLENMRFKTKDELLKLFKDAGLDFDKPTVSTCYIGHTASTFYLLAKYICGMTDLRVYYGSWTEYGQRTVP